MSNQLQITGGAKVRNLEGVLTGTSGVVGALGINVANGIPKLDSNAKILVSQLPNSVMEYKGTWNAATNTPTLANGTGNQGDVYLCNVAGTTNFGAGAITFAVGDQVIYSGTIWQKAGGSTGTVTSVAITESGDALTITGSPITTSGTINIGFAGTSGQYINGAGGLTTFPSLTGYVPYTGATGNVNLGEYGLSGGYLGLDTTPTGTPTSLGTLSWDDTYLTPKVITGTGATTLQVGQEEVVLIHNNTGSTLTDGQVVYINGSTGNLPTVALADASSETTSAATLGVVTESIANGSNGFITISGNVNGLNTTGYTAGDILWLSETAGQFTNVKPVSPAHLVLIGYVVKVSGGNGSILVKIQNTQELEECSDVLFTSLANNDILAYESSTDLWKNKTIANVLGYTPANDSLVVHLAGNETITGSKTFSAATEFTSSQSVAFNYGLGIAKGNTPSIFSSSAVYLYSASGDNNLIIKDNTNTSKLQFQAASSYTYTFPASTGTVALTSDIPSLTGYVPYTGATSSLNLGNYGLTASSVFVSSVGTNAGQVQLKQGSVFTTPNGYGTFGSGGANDFYFYQNTSSVVRGAILSLGSITASATRTYTLPDADGTLALTSQIPSLSGYVQGSGTTNYHAKFTASSTIGNSMLTDDGTTLQSIGATRSNLYLKAASNSYYSQLAFTNGSNGSFGGISYNNSGQYMQFEANSSEWMRLTSDGKLGIGTTSPSYTLDVQVNNSTFVNRVINLNTTTDSAGLLVQAGVNAGNEIALFRNAAGSDRFTFLSNGNATFSGTLTANGVSIGASDIRSSSNVLTIGGTSEVMRIVGSTGNVGIGTNSPAFRLHVVGPTNGVAYISGTSNAYRAELALEANGQFTGSFVANPSASSTYNGIGTSLVGITTSSTAFVIATSNTERLRVNTSGHVLIGQTSASGGSNGIYFRPGIESGFVVTNDIALQLSRLSSTGDIQSFYSGSTRVGTISVSGSNTSYNTSSDYRLKEDLKEFNGIDLVSKIKTYDFKWKLDNTRNYGVIAHEIEKIIPYVVMGEKDGEFYQGVDYSKIVPILIKAIQELKAEIDELKNK
jgi:Chaperone of endosialidase